MSEHLDLGDRAVTRLRSVCGPFAAVLEDRHKPGNLPVHRRDDDLLAGRSINSSLAMTRDSLFDTAADTNNEAPPDIATGSANSTHNMDLISGEDGGTDDKDLVDTVVDTINDLFSGGTTEPPKPPDAGTVRPEGDTAVPKPKPKAQPRPGSEDDYMTSPDADTGGTSGNATDADIERAIAKQGADTDFVEGFARGPAITGDSPSFCVAHDSRRRNPN